jgi:RNA polymerase sigma factor (sigma-70 family)
LERDRIENMAITLSHDGANLVELARAGDQPALERLLAKSLPDLRRYAKRNCQSDDIEEAVQDALWILYRNVSALRSVAAFAGWLFQVVRRICQGYSRRRKIDLPIDQLPKNVERDQTAGDPEMRAILSGILARLPQVYREVIVLKDIQGLSAEEMATTLNITLEAAKSRLHRSRAMVRESYETLRIRSENQFSAISGASK